MMLQQRQMVLHSINVYTGPPLHKKIFDLLLRFRTQPVALIGDIEKAFLMIKIKEADPEVLRFLRYDDVTKEKPELKANKFTRVVFGVSPSPYLLNATIDKHLEQFEDRQETRLGLPSRWMMSSQDSQMLLRPFSSLDDFFAAETAFHPKFN